MGWSYDTKGELLLTDFAYEPTDVGEVHWFLATLIRQASLRSKHLPKTPPFALTD